MGKNSRVSLPLMGGVLVPVCLLAGVARGDFDALPPSPVPSSTPKSTPVATATAAATASPHGATHASPTPVGPVVQGTPLKSDPKGKGSKGTNGGSGSPSQKSKTAHNSSSNVEFMCGVFVGQAPLGLGKNLPERTSEGSDCTIKQDGAILKAQKMTGFFKGSSTQPYKALAVGKVDIIKKDENGKTLFRAVAERAEYDFVNHTVTLDGLPPPRIWEEGSENSHTATRMEYNMLTGVLKEYSGLSTVSDPNAINPKK